MIEQFLDLSTAHLTQDEMADIAGADVRVLSYEYGAVVWVPEDMPFGMAVPYPNLCSVLYYARRHGCSLVRFDQDAATVPGLALFEW